jgi:DNA-binding NtrC family response regulator
MKLKILLVEDKDSLREMLKQALEEDGYGVEATRDGIEAVHHIKTSRFLCILSDLRLPHVEGLEILRVAKEVDPDNIVVFMTAYGSIEIAVEAIKNGAYDFLPKPVDINHLLLLVGRIEADQQLRYENMILKEEFSRRLGFPRIIGEDSSFRELTLSLQKAAPTDATILITGESGTGKELFARASLPCRQLCCNPGNAAGKRAVRTRKGCFHRSHESEAGEVRGGRGRNSLPG